MQLFKTSTTAAAFALVAACGLLITSSQAANDNNPTQDEKIKIEIGQRIAPVTLNLTKKDKDTVYLGSYLVNALTGCSLCHTAPSGKYLAGGWAFGLALSRNLTPDSTGRPAGLVYSDFVRAVRNGVDYHNSQYPQAKLRPTMPWIMYQNMTDRDLTAIYTYISAVPCEEGTPGVPNGPTHRCAGN
jgi:hypothetical protein